MTGTVSLAGREAAAASSPDGVQLHPVTSWAAMCEATAAVVQVQPAGPLSADLVVVPSQGHRRALSQHLAVRAGGPLISAGIDFITWAALAARLNGSDDPAAADPWRGAQLGLAVWDVLDAHRDEPALAPLVHHVAPSGERPGRPHATSRRIARLFARYADTAPAMVDDWVRGRDVDAGGEPLTARDLWQPFLWRGLTEVLGEDPSVRHRLLLGRLREAPAPGFPPRVVVNAVNDPTPAQADILAALATHHEVHLVQLSGTRSGGTMTGSAFGRQYGRRPGLPIPLDGAAPAPTLLAKVQHELRNDLPPADGRADGTLQVHACHGADRQVEVLRDVLCGLLSDDPQLQPRDIVVLCTDLTQYAPLISAAFNLDGTAGTDLHPGHRLRAQLAASSLAFQNPVLGVLVKLFEIHSGRATSTDLIDLCQLGPVANRFGFGPDQVDRIVRLVSQANIRWGLDTGQRQRNGLHAVTQSTWFAGVERMLASLALDDRPPIQLGTVTPVPHVSGGDAGLVGALAELVSRVRKVLFDFDEQAPAGVWIERLRAAIDLLVAVGPDDGWQLQQALGALATLAERSEGRCARLGAADMAAWVRDEAAGQGGRPNYGNGSMLFTELGDLQAIEAKVVCVLGLDDEHFPGTSPMDGDDLLGRPGAVVGRHWTQDRRALRRQQLLDALLAARETFVVITKGADERTGAFRPEPNCIAGLLAACQVPDGIGKWRPKTDRGALVQWHPLHPHGWADFDVVSRPRAFSFDRQALAGAHTLTEPPVPAQPRWQLVHRQDEGPPADLEIEDLVTFFQHPARALLARAAGTNLTDYDDRPAVELPIAPDNLEQWSIGSELLDLLVAGHDIDAVTRTVWLGGRVPPGPPGGALIEDKLVLARQTAAAVIQARSQPARLVDCQVALPGRTLRGRVQMHGHRVVVYRYGKVRAVDALACWLRLLAIAASQRPRELRLTGLLLGKKCFEIEAPDPLTARRLLGELAALRDQGLQRVLPLPITAAAGHADLLVWSSGSPLERARREYKRDENWQYFFDSFDDVLKPRPEPADPAGDGSASRFEVLAQTLLGPIKARLSEVRPNREWR